MGCTQASASGQKSAIISYTLNAIETLVVQTLSCIFHFRFVCFAFVSSFHFIVFKMSHRFMWALQYVIPL